VDDRPFFGFENQHLELPEKAMAEALASSLEFLIEREYGPAVAGTFNG
jgi:hypothetical protein